MTGHTHSFAEWAQMLSLAVAIYGAYCVPYFLLVDADPSDFDPRPAVRRWLKSVAAAQLAAEARDLAVSAAALLLLCSPAPALEATP